LSINGTGSVQSVTLPPATREEGCGQRQNGRRHKPFLF